MTKEHEIEKLRNTLIAQRLMECDMRKCRLGKDCDACIAICLYEEGYRKADEVIKETLEAVLTEASTGPYWDVDTDELKQMIKDLGKQLGVEVDDEMAGL